MLRYIGPTVQSENELNTLVELHPEIEEIQIGSAGYGIRNSISNTCLSSLLRLPELTHLELWYPVLSGDGGLNMLSAPNLPLKYIVLKHCRITDECLSLLLEKCVHLEHLDIQGTNVSGENLTFSQGVPPIKYLNLSCCLNLSDCGLINLVKILGSTLEFLNIGQTKLSLQNLALIKKPLKIKRLQCWHCHNLRDEGLKQIIKKLGSSLQQLDLKLTLISGESLRSLKVSMPLLRDLNCFGSSLSDPGLLNLIRLSGPALKSLNIGYTMVSGELPLANTLPLLEVLDCNGCCRLSPEGLAELVNAFGDNLKSVNVEYSKLWRSQELQYAG